MEALFSKRAVISRQRTQCCSTFSTCAFLKFFGLTIGSEIDNIYTAAECAQMFSNAFALTYDYISGTPERR